MEETKCPCCGSTVDRDLPLVSRETNLVTYGKQTIKLSPAQTIIADVLVSSWPSMVANDRIIQRMWDDEPERPDISIRTQMHRVRMVMRQLGFDVASVYSEGYRLARRDLPAAVRA